MEDNRICLCAICGQGSWDLAQWVNRLLHRCKSLSLDPQEAHKVGEGGVCNPRVPVARWEGGKTGGVCRSQVGWSRMQHRAKGFVSDDSGVRLTLSGSL